jgi:FkbM family methyltransferase
VYRPAQGAGLTREAIVWAYRLFLGREPESEAVVAEKQARCPDLATLRDDFLEADEYRRHRPPCPEAGGLDAIFQFLYGRRPTAEEAAILDDLPGPPPTDPAGAFRRVLARFDQQSRATAFSVRLTESDLRYADHHGLQMAVDQADAVVGAPLLWGYAYEPHLTRFFERHVRPGMTVVDVGANVGYYTVLSAALVGELGRVIAFEPNSENCRLILLSIHKNGLQNVTLYPLGLSDQAGPALFSVHMGSNGGLLSSAEATLRNPSCVVIPTMRLDDLLGGTPIDLLKLDAEGAEGLIVAGAWGVIEHNRPIITTEFSTEMLPRVSGISGRAYLDQFRSLGYRTFLIDRATAALDPIDDLDAFLDGYALGRIEDLALLPTSGRNALS